MRHSEQPRVTYAHSIIIVCAITMIIIGIVFLFAPSVEAQEVTLTSSVKAAYLGPDGAVWYDKPVFQSDVLVAWEKGFYIDLWSSSAFNTRKNWDKEIDATLGYSRSWKRLGYSVEGIYFAILDGDIFHAKSELSLDLKYFTPFVEAGGYWPTSKGGPKEGALYTGGVRTGLPLGKTSTLSLEVSGRYDTGAFGYDRAWLAFGTAMLEVGLGKKTAILTRVTVSEPMTVVTDGRKLEVVWEIGFSHRFK